MYWSIQTSYDTQHLTNLFYDNHVYTFTKLPMGWVNSCYIGQSATEMAYSQETMLEILKFKSFQLNSKECPFSEIRQLLIVYMDDICCFYGPLRDEVSEWDRTSFHHLSENLSFSAIISS